MALPRYNSTTHRPILGPDGKPASDCICCGPTPPPPPPTYGCYACCDATPQVFSVDLSNLNIGPGLKSHFFSSTLVDKWNPLGPPYGIYCVPMTASGYGTQKLQCAYGDGPLYVVNGVCTRTPWNSIDPVIYPTDNPRLRWNGGTLGSYPFKICRSGCDPNYTTGCYWCLDAELPKNWIQFKSYVTDSWVDSERIVLTGSIGAFGGTGVTSSWVMDLSLWAVLAPEHRFSGHGYGLYCTEDSGTSLNLAWYLNQSPSPGVCKDPISFEAGPNLTNSSGYYPYDHGIRGTIIATPQQLGPPCDCVIPTLTCNSVYCASTCSPIIVCSVSYPDGGATTWYEGNSLFYYSTACTWVIPANFSTLYCSSGYWYIEFRDGGGVLVLKAKTPNTGGCPVSGSWEIVYNTSSTTPVISTWHF